MNSASPLSSEAATPARGSSGPRRGLSGGDGIYTEEVNARILESLGPPNELLFLAACSEGDADEVDRLLLATNVSVDCEDENGDTGLLLAARQGHVDVVKRLLQTRGQKGIDVNRAPRGWTPLLVAASKGNTEVVRLLLADKRTNVAARTPAGDTALHCACRLRGCDADVLSLLVDAGLDPNEKNDTEWTPFLLACVRNPSSVKILLEAGADPSVRTKQGNTALHLAVSHDRSGDSVAVLLDDNRTDISATIVGGWTAFHLACARGNILGVEALLENPACDPGSEPNSGTTGYVLAAQNNQRAVVRLLIARGFGHMGRTDVVQVAETPIKRRREDCAEDSDDIPEEESHLTPANKRHRTE